MSDLRQICLLALMGVALLLAGMLPARGSDLLEDETELLETLDDEKKNELVAAPIPIVNPTFGTGLALGAMYLYHLDESSQPSFTAAGVAYTDSNSYAFGIGQAAYFKDDAWKIKGGAGVFDVNVPFYGVGRVLGDRGISIPLNAATCP